MNKVLPLEIKIFYKFDMIIARVNDVVVLYEELNQLLYYEFQL